jgi:2-polyprenyl-3-methyl-5-hydroxy-6-metoxy-1,4-benzoquinol methylase
MNPSEYVKSAKDELLSESKKYSGMPSLASYTANAAEWYHLPPTTSMVNISKWMPDARVLDVGCGYGTLSIVASMIGWKVDAIDYYFPHIPWRIRQKYDIDMRICNIEYETIPFDSELYDLVVMIEVIEHLNGPVKYALSEIYRVLKYDRYLLIGTPNADVWELEDGTDCWEDYDNATHTDPYHSRHFTVSELEENLTSVGFEIVSTQLHRDDKHILTLARKV